MALEANCSPLAPVAAGFLIDRQLDEGEDDEEDEDGGGADGPADLQARVAVDLRGDARLAWP